MPQVEEPKAIGNPLSAMARVLFRKGRGAGESACEEQETEISALRTLIFGDDKAVLLRVDVYQE